MSHRKRPQIEEDDLAGFKYFKKISRLLAALHARGCARDRAGNRQLFMDQYLSLLLLFMFNPICESLRGLQQASALKKVQRVLGVPRASLGSLSEAARVFDATRLPEIVGQLAQESGPWPHDARLDQVQELLTLVDGHLPDGLAADRPLGPLAGGPAAAKAHVEFEVLKGVPVAATITAANASETAVLRAACRSRLYCHRPRLRRVRLLSSHPGRPEQLRRPPAGQGRAGGPPRAARRGGGGPRRCAARHSCRLGSKLTRDDLSVPVRVVEVACRPHRKPSGKTGRGGPDRRPPASGDQPPGPAAGGHRRALPVALADRDLLSHLQARPGCRHLLSYSDNGNRPADLRGDPGLPADRPLDRRRPTLRTVEMIRFYFSGWATLEELEAHIAGCRNHRRPCRSERSESCHTGVRALVAAHGSLATPACCRAGPSVHTAPPPLPGPLVHGAIDGPNGIGTVYYFLSRCPSVFAELTMPSYDWRKKRTDRPARSVPLPGRRQPFRSS